MRDKIKLVSSAGTGHYYTTTKNKRTMPYKIEMKKFGYGEIDVAKFEKFLEHWEKPWAILELNQ